MSTKGTEPARVLIWTGAVLPGSETFIRNQSDALRRWSPKLAGLFRQSSPLSRHDDRSLYTSSRLDAFLLQLFKLTGHSRRADRLIRTWQPQVIHAHFLPNGWRISRSAQRHGVPLLVTAHGSDALSWPRQRGLRGVFAKHQMRQVFRRAALIFAVSEFVRRRIIELGAEPHKVVVHYTGIPISSTPSSGRNKHWDVAFVGRFVEVKGIFDLIDSLDLVAAHQATSAVLVGDGELMSLVRERASRSMANITILGQQSPEAARRVIEQSRVLAGPSRKSSDGSIEGLGMVFLEAAASGVPVVATVHGGIPEAVRHGATGLLSPEGDIVALADNIRRVLNDEAFANQLAMAGRTRALEFFDVERQTAKLEEIYDAIVRNDSDA